MTTEKLEQFVRPTDALVLYSPTAILPVRDYDNFIAEIHCFEPCMSFAVQKTTFVSQ